MAPSNSFDLERFVSDCVAACEESTPERAIRELVERSVSDPERLVQAIGAPRSGGIQRIHVSPDLTILNVIWPPRMTLMAHDHNMWAVIGVYTGREDNIFWRRRPGDPRGRIEAAGAKSLGPGEVRPLGRDVIHSVTNPTARPTGALHVYGGDFFAMARSEWDPETLEERPYDIERNLRLFEEANAWWTREEA